MRSAAIQNGVSASFSGWRVFCALFGHQAANRCDCSKSAVAQEFGSIHIRHVLSCFLGGHEFERLVNRSGHIEYVCHACGHQLLVAYPACGLMPLSFWKRPRYWCSLFGHRVHALGKRSALVEYVCGCGHSFLKPLENLKRIKHPLTCTAFGHFVRLLCRRDGCSEYLCSICGHTFCYPDAKKEE